MAAAKTKTKLEATLDKVIIRKEEPERVRASGLILPDTARGQDKREVGTVLCVGPGTRNAAGGLVPVDGIAAGDKVVYQRYLGCEVEVDGESLVVVPAQGVIAKIVG
jgi:co-chaperonin GroES (HSP10)